MVPTYIIDDADGTDFFLGCCAQPLDYSGTADLHRGTWGGFTPLAIPGLRASWHRPGHEKRRADSAALMRSLWQEGRIKPHVTTPELQAARRRAAQEAWDRRRAGELPMPKRGRTTSGRSCTVDGVHIFPSARALIAALGKGRNGYGHPNFRFL